MSWTGALVLPSSSFTWIVELPKDPIRGVHCGPRKHKPNRSALVESDALIVQE
jgi:hypothetical protein